MTQKPNTLQIERADAYKVGDTFYPCLTAAKRGALIKLLPASNTMEATVDYLLQNADAAIEILAWGESARKPKRKPRSDIGKEHRKPTTPPEAPQPVGVKVEGSGKYANK